MDDDIKMIEASDSPCSRSDSTRHFRYATFKIKDSEIKSLKELVDLKEK